MLKSLEIHNFQSHRDTKVVFSEGLTCFQGLNNHGKSVIFRALKKVVRNKPTGSNFVSDWADTCTIILETDKGTVTRKIRSVQATDANMYIIGESEEYASFGLDIPPAVLACLGISQPQTFSNVDLDINFQSQLDVMFLVQGDGLPSLRGKVLSRVTGVDVAQRGIQKSAALEREHTKDINTTTKDINGFLLNLKEYDNVDELQADVENLRIKMDETDILQTPG
jgi:exonuclease SbcC